MNKKIPLFISTALLSVSTIIATPASATVESGSATWSLEEMARLRDEIGPEAKASCDNDPKCEENFYRSKENTGESIYAALRTFRNQTLLIASINPALEKISLYYNDENPRMRNRGVDERANITEAYLFWLADGMIGPAKDTKDIRAYSETVKNQITTAGVYPLISRNNETDGENWLLPRTETEFSVTGSDLNLNAEGTIYFTVNTNSLTIGLIDYSDCLNSPDYREGMECRVVFDDTGEIKYRPFDVTNTSAVSSSEQPTEAISPELDGGGLGFASDSQLAELPSQSSTTTVGDTQGPIIQTIPPAAPNTGIAPAVLRDAVEFPWWLGFILFINGVILARFFWPLRHRQRRKSLTNMPKNANFPTNLFRKLKLPKNSPKKSKKVVDKLPQVR